jgi:deazaflavin-dependent oxidoreductase (nitroreductase family)
MPSALTNSFIKFIVNSRLHPILGLNFAVLSVTGRKSSRIISFPVNTFHQDDIYNVITLRKRTWWRNLKSEPRASLRIRGRSIEVDGEIVESQEAVAEFLMQYFTANPDLARYLDVRLDTNKLPVPEDVVKATAGRLVVRLKPV